MLQEEEFCHEFHLVDLRLYDNCKKVCEGCEHVFNLAADMGGMGFIQVRGCCWLSPGVYGSSCGVTVAQGEY